MRPEVTHWWEQAEEDLDAVRHNAAGGKYYAAAFFCHQAAEKALRALPKAQSSEPTLFTPSVPSSVLRPASGASSASSLPSTSSPATPTPRTDPR